MTQASLTNYARLNNELKQLPRHLVHQFCRENGFQSWHCNAKQNPNYNRWCNDERQY